MIHPIDFVIPWVDGSDPEWIKEKNYYANNASTGTEAARFRDWEQLRYVFRGIEKNAPWVNRVHFITCGHLPSWLNTSHPKLNIVRHSDYIPKEYLPTFSSYPIELNMHRIPGLSEHFVYFNDDIFIVNPVKQTDFFVGGMPKATAGLDIIKGPDLIYADCLHEDVALIERNFGSRKVIKKQFWKFISPKYNFRDNIRTLLLLPYCKYFFPGLFFWHGPNAYLKSTIEEVWNKEEQKLSETSRNKFRCYGDVNQYIFLGWQCCKGDFIPANRNKRLLYTDVQKPEKYLADIITNCKQPFLVINDVGELTDTEFKEKKTAINGAFEAIFSEKSQFELF
jgi:hypothetical protein